MSRIKAELQPQERATILGRGSSWTNGRDLSAKLTTGALVAAIVCGPLALVVAFAGTSTQPASVADSTGSALTTTEQSTGAYSLAYVAAWLSATKEDPGQLADYIGLESIPEISDVPWAYRNIAVASTLPAEAGHLVTVVVSANVKELGVEGQGKTTTDVWPRRYFQVTVKAADTNMRVLGLPSPIAGPAQGEPANLDYSQSLPLSDATADAVSAFLGAYLAESGEIARYISPDSEITAIVPAPYVAVDLVDVRADVAPSTSPADGETVAVLVTAALSSAVDQKLTATYALSLTARAGRWEVAAIEAAPIETSDSETNRTNPTPSPTGDGTSKGK